MLTNIASMTIETQQDFLKSCKSELGVTWDKFAELAGVVPSTFKTYRMPCDSKHYRAMNKFVLDAIVRVVRQRKKSK